MERETYDCSDLESIHYASKEIVDGAKTEAGIRSLPLIPLAVEIIDLVKSVNKQNGLYNDSFLFLNSKGTRMVSWKVKYRIEKYCDENGIKRKSFHKKMVRVPTGSQKNKSTNPTECCKIGTF